MAGTPLATAFVRVRPDTSTFKRDTEQSLNRASRTFSAQGKKHGRVFGTTFAKSTAGPFKSVGGIFTRSLAGIGGAFAAIGIAQFGKDSVQAFSEAQQAQIRLSDSFKRFPKLADTNIGALRKLNTQLAAKTRFDDDALASGQAILAQFSLTGKQIEGLTPLVADYAAKSGKDVPTAAKLLGKAFLGNTRALKDLGINYKLTGDRQKDVANITDLVRQKVGGFAEKEGKSAAGRVEILKNQFGELQEDLGAKLLPVLSAVVSFLLTKLIPGIQAAAKWLGPRLGPIIQAVSGFVRDQLVPAVKAFAGFIVDSVVPAVQKWLGILANALQPALKAIGEVWKQNIRPALKGLFDAVQRNWPAFKRLATIILTVAGFLLKVLLPPIIRVAGILISLFFRNIARTITILGTLIRWLITAGKAVGVFATTTARQFVRWYQAARDAVQKVVDFFRKLPGRITRAVGGLGRLLYNKGKAVITGFWNGVKNVWSSVISWFKGLPRQILNALGIHSPPKWAIEAGKHIMGGILKGVVPGGKDLLQFAKNTVASIAGIGGGGGLLGRLIGAGGGAISGSAVQIGQRMAASVGWTGAQWRALYDLWNNESGWNPLADNPTSTAFGIPQFLAGTARQYGVYGSTDPARQIAAGLQYIADRYGSPLNAWNAWLSRSPHWYKEGTPWVPATGLYGLHEGEAVIPAKYNKPGVATTRVVVDVTGADTDLKRLIRKMIRVQGGTVA